MTQPGIPDPHAAGPENGRRRFLKGAAALAIGGVAVLPAPLAGLRAFLDPLARSAGSGRWAFVTRLTALPEDGIPRRFPVIAEAVNAWTRTPATTIGAVFLRRTGAEHVEAFSVVCPHAGCLVDYVPSSQHYLCPCHNSTFAPDGRVNDPDSPSPRALDSLEVQLRNQTEVWVRYQTFRSGPPEKVPVG
jgi:menaquinol-cytochrome c reductase iron-sulfur subunit